MSSFLDYIHEVFEPFGPVTTRPMFGGHSIFHDGLTFALVDEDILYLKADAKSIHLFEDKNLPRFTFEMKGKLGSMNYYQAPDEMFEDPENALYWATIAFEAALRAKAKKKPKKKPSPKKGI